MAGFDQKSNVVLSDSKERVYSMEEGVEEIPLGLYLVKGDQMCVFLLFSYSFLGVSSSSFRFPFLFPFPLPLSPYPWYPTDGELQRSHRRARRSGRQSRRPVDHTCRTPAPNTILTSTWLV